MLPELTNDEAVVEKLFARVPEIEDAIFLSFRY